MCIQEITIPIGKDLEVNPKDIAISSDESQEWIHKYNKSRYSGKCPYCGNILHKRHIICKIKKITEENK